MIIQRLEIDANGLTFSARAAGPEDGRPVLLLHGFPQTSAAWRRQLVTLADAGYRAVAIDQRGYSTKARPEGVEQYAIVELVSDVVEIADALGMPTFDLIGHDWGGAVAWTLAAVEPERLRSLCVVSTPHPAAQRYVILSGNSEQRKKSRYIQQFKRPDEPERVMLGPNGDGSGLRTFLLGSEMDPEFVEEYVAVLTEPGAMTAALNWYRAMDGAATEKLPLIEVPTTYVWSTEDVALGRAAAEATARYVTGRYRFEVLEGVNHWVPESAPEELGRLILEHLSTT